MKTKNVLEKNFKKYAEMFPNNQELAWMATRGGQGHAPSAGIKVFENSGHYILRNGWDKTSTMLIHSNNYSNEKMDIWSHNQPDNGTFELYHNGVTFSLIPEYLLMEVVELLIIFAVGSVKQNLITQ